MIRLRKRAAAPVSAEFVRQMKAEREIRRARRRHHATTLTDVCGLALLTAAAWLGVGMALGLAVAGVVVLTLSYLARP